MQHVRERSENVRNTCDTCQGNSSATHRFQAVILHSDFVFSSKVVIDLMTTRKRTILLIVDHDKTFLIAVQLTKEDNAHAWSAFPTHWACLYTVYYNLDSLAQRLQLKSAAFTSILQSAKILHRCTGVEFPSSLDKAEHNYAQLKHAYEKVRAEHRTVSHELTLKLADKAYNDAAGPLAFSPLLHVSSVLSHLPLYSRELPEHRERLGALYAARQHKLNLTTRACLETAHLCNVSSTADRRNKIGNLALVY